MNWLSLFLLLLGAIILFYLLTRTQMAPRLTSYLSSSLSLRYEQNLYWLSLYLQDSAGNGNNYDMALDSGNNLITLPGPTCPRASSPKWPSVPTTPNASASYEGGQQITYQLAPAYCPLLSQTFQVAVMNNGSNPRGNLVNLFGLLDPSLVLTRVILDFPAMSVSLSSDNFAPLSSPSASLHKLPYWSIPVSGISGVDWIILDTGTNYVLVDPSLTVNGALSFNIGDVNINVPPNLIYRRKALMPRSLILGHLVMSKYRWEIDLAHLQVRVSGT